MIIYNTFYFSFNSKVIQYYMNTAISDIFILIIQCILVLNYFFIFNFFYKFNGKFSYYAAYIMQNIISFPRVRNDIINVPFYKISGEKVYIKNKKTCSLFKNFVNNFFFLYILIWRIFNFLRQIQYPHPLFTRKF